MAISKTARDGVVRAFQWARARLMKPATVPPELWVTPSLENVKSQSRILVVDDEDLAHYSQLRTRGFNVKRLDAVDATASRTMDTDFDLLILDIRGIRDHFGAEDGIEALPMIRKDNPWIPIILFTAHMDDNKEKIARAEQLTQAVEPKSLRFADFEDRVIFWLRQARSRDYAVQSLARLGVANASDLADRLGRENVAALKPFLSEAANSSSQSRDYQAKNLLETLNSIARGARWHQNEAK